MNKRISVERAISLLKEHYGVAAVEIKELLGYDDQNFIVTEQSKDKCNRYVFKVIQNTKSNREVFQEVSLVIGHLNRKGLPVPSAIKTKSQDYIQTISSKDAEKNQSLIIQLLTYLNGNTLRQANFTEPELKSAIQEAGKIMAHINKELQNVECRYDLRRSDYRWNISNTEFCPTCYPLIEDRELRRICIDVNKQFETEVIENICDLRRCIIHGDANSGNIIVETNNNTSSILNGFRSKIVGLIDFSDIMDSRIVFEVATFMAYMMCKAFDDGYKPLDAAVEARQGFESVLLLTEAERKVLYICIMKRMAVSVCSAWLEKSLGADEEKLNDLPAMSSLIKILWLKGQEKTTSELFRSD